MSPPYLSDAVLDVAETATEGLRPVIHEAEP